jgi:hypothetical protein
VRTYTAASHTQTNTCCPQNACLAHGQRVHTTLNTTGWRYTPSPVAHSDPWTCRRAARFFFTWQTKPTTVPTTVYAATTYLRLPHSSLVQTNVYTASSLEHKCPHLLHAVIHGHDDGQHACLALGGDGHQRVRLRRVRLRQCRQRTRHNVVTRELLGLRTCTRECTSMAEMCQRQSDRANYNSAHLDNTHPRELTRDGATGSARPSTSISHQTHFAEHLR